MTRDFPVNPAWRNQVVATMNPRGEVHLLLSIRRLLCSECGIGIRFETDWCSPADEPHRLTWCSTCFDANCVETELSEELEQRSLALLEQHTLGLDVPYWSSARPAIEDLERRGLI